MTNEEILTKAIEKAVKNGYQKGKGGFLLKTIEEDFLNLFPEKIIFDHEFAKAFFGERAGEKEVKIIDENVCGSCFHLEVNPLWKIALQQLALSKDRLKYISQYL